VTSSPKTARIRFPFETRQLRLTVTLGCILIGVILALAMMWLLVYQSVISSTEGPAEVGAYSTKLQMSWYGASGELLKKPAGIAFDHKRQLAYVVDSHRARIEVLNTAGEKVSSFDGGDDEEFALQLPTSIAVASTGQVYVVDATLQKLIIFDKSLQPVRAISFKEEPPKAVAVVEGSDGAEQLWVVSYSGVTRGTLDGDFDWGYYARGRDIGQFNNPTALTGRSVEESTTIYVCDTFNYRVQAFDVAADGLRIKWTYGGPSDDDAAGGRSTTRYLDLPVDVAIDDEGRIFILDGMGATIVTLDSETGELITAFGAVGSKEGQLLYPSSLTYGNEQIWVADQGNSRVSVFSQKEAPPPPQLTRQHLPLELLWLLVLFLILIEAGCLTWLARIQSTRMIFSMDALERVEAREKGMFITDIVEHVNVAPGIEAFAQQICEGARVATVSLSQRKAQRLDALRMDLSPLDFNTLLGAHSMRKSVLVADDGGHLYAIAEELGVPVIDVTMLIQHIDSIIEKDEQATSDAREL